jgi:hypothetical protein
MKLQEVGWMCLEWINLAQNRDGWSVLVNVVIKLWVPYTAGNFLTGWKTVSSEEGLCYMELVS